jgi:hypothetical protein
LNIHCTIANFLPSLFPSNLPPHFSAISIFFG